MIKIITKIFKYIEPLWLGVDGRISLRAVGFIALTIDFISNAHTAVYKWEVGKSFEGLSLLAGIEAGFAATLLGLSLYQNINKDKLESQAANPPPAPINIEKAETVTVPTTNTTNTTKAENVNAENVETVNTNSTNIAQLKYD